MYARMADDARNMIDKVVAITGLSQSMVIHSLCRKALGLPGVPLDRAVLAARKMDKSDDGTSDSTG
jgi:hypothetical protein